MKKYTIGERVICSNNKLLDGNDYGPPLVLGGVYTIVDITLDKQGNQHLDVGLKSMLNYVSSFETGEKLPNGDKIHWCHPSRFK